MSNIYQDIENAIVAKLQADSWFFNQTDPKTPKNVRTVRSDVPETAAPVVEFTEIFPDADLPGIAILSLIDAPTVDPSTLGELQYEVPIKILGVVLENRKAEARNKTQELAGQIERVLNACRRSATALSLSGRGNFVKKISSTVDVRPGKTPRRWFGLMEMDLTVVVVQDY